MNLNKNRKKYHRFKYDGKKIILIGKKEIYPFVYKRIWDLTQYDKDVLEKYDLKKAKYIYIGSSDKYNLRKRCTDWKIEIIKNRKNVAKHIRQFIFNLKAFYELETSYTFEEIDYLLYYNASVIARCESKEVARKLEQHFTSHYHDLDSYGEILDKHIILLSKVDSELKEIKYGTITVLKVKNKVA